MTVRQVLLAALIGASLAAMLALTVFLVAFTAASLLTVSGAWRRERRRRRLTDLQDAFGALLLAELDEGLEQLISSEEINRADDLHYGHRSNFTEHPA